MTEESSSARQEDALPFFSESVAAGFPSPALGDIQGSLDLNSLCIRHPAATYYVRARGESMLGAGIEDGDILVVDRALSPADGNIIIAAVNGEFTVKRLEIRDGSVRLLPENPAYRPIELCKSDEAEFFGVVTWVIKQLKKS
ncbi:MAG: translesion error-prone DNA polymerase V autoproteolytic subunit [Akkermansia sp.]|nr:translesion error-prone DNA polymerase V autoproteolytic subunit [Akkermansia sp.]